MNTNKSYMKINNVNILVLKKNIKNFHLNVLPPNWDVRISVPHWTHDDVIKWFASMRMPWIKKQIENMKDQPRETPREYISWESHYYLWKRYLLEVIEDDKFWIVFKNNKTIVFTVPKNSTLEQKEKFMDNRYREEMKKIVPKLLKKWEKITWIKAQSWEIRKMKRLRWSCDQKKGKIVLNFELIKKPKVCIEYVILHELIHFKERTHNENFVNYMDQYMPKWRSRRDDLNNMILSYSMS